MHENRIRASDLESPSQPKLINIDDRYGKCFKNSADVFRTFFSDEIVKSIDEANEDRVFQTETNDPLEHCTKRKRSTNDHKVIDRSNFDRFVSVHSCMGQVNCPKESNYWEVEVKQNVSWRSSHVSIVKRVFDTIQGSLEYDEFKRIRGSFSLVARDREQGFGHPGRVQPLINQVLCPRLNGRPIYQASSHTTLDDQSARYYGR